MTLELPDRMRGSGGVSDLVGKWCTVHLGNSGKQYTWKLWYAVPEASLPSCNAVPEASLLSCNGITPLSR